VKIYHMTEEPYPDAWSASDDSLRVTLPNRFCDPKIAADLFHRYLDEWVLCDELGINLFINEHHATATCMTSSVNLILAICARITKNVRMLCLGMPIGNRSDPVRVAEEVAIVDVISRGRLDLGFVRGVPYEVIPSNANPVRAADRFWEAHDLIVKAMTTHDGPFSWEGEYYDYRSVNIWPRPYQQPHPPIWISANTPGSVRRIAEHAYVLGTVMTGYRAKNLFDEYRRVWRELGRPEPFPLDRLCYCSFVAVGKTEQEGLRRGDQVMQYLRSNAIVAEPFKNPPGYAPIRANAQNFLKTGSIGLPQDHNLYAKDGERICLFREATVEQTMRGGLMFAGTADQVYDQIIDFYETVGGFEHLQMMAQAGSMSHEDTCDSLRLFAKHVKPRLEEYYASARLAIA
jgi:alkanesulfonate monooxygenase SsuD/methylene tetrahydromethanopterin reductase-like flavin-dependent oxidoreductase (luciferase family)